MTNSGTVEKSPDAFRTISEVAEALKLPQHVLRFWETRFTQIRPLKRGGGRRFYRPDDVELLMAIRQLLYGEGYTIRGVQRILKEQGPRAVAALAQKTARELAAAAPVAAHAEDVPLGPSEAERDDAFPEEEEEAGGEPMPLEPPEAAPLEAETDPGAAPPDDLLADDASPVDRLKAVRAELDECRRILRDAAER